MVAEFIKVATTLEVPPGVMKMIQVADQEVCLANVDGKFYAVGTCAPMRRGLWTRGGWKSTRSNAPGTGPDST